MGLLKPLPRAALLLKRGRPRRALTFLGENNSKLNLQMAESLMTISATEFTQKWNFDPIRGVPLTAGRYQWGTTPCKAPRPPDGPREALGGGGPEKVHTVAVEGEGEAPRDSSGTSPAADHPCHSRTCACGVQEGAAANIVAGRSDNSAPLEAKSGEAATPVSENGEGGPAVTPPCPTKLRQTSITEFARPQKKKTSCPAADPQKKTSCPAVDPQKKTSCPARESQSQGKKRSSSSLPDLHQPPHKKVMLQLRA